MTSERICPACGGPKYRYALKCQACTGNARMAIADRYGRLAVLGEVPPQGPFKHRMLKVRCDCGTEKVVRFSHLRAGRIVSCGCASRERATKHGEIAGAKKAGHRTPEYDAWLAMNQRCTNPKNPRWKDYGGRGITVCAAWRESFEAFLRDMGRRPTPAHSIDRYPDNDGNYEPTNCRWATGTEQQSNRRNSPAQRSA